MASGDIHNTFHSYGWDGLPLDLCAASTEVLRPRWQYAAVSWSAVELDRQNVRDVIGRRVSTLPRCLVKPLFITGLVIRGQVCLDVRLGGILADVLHLRAFMVCCASWVVELVSASPQGHLDHPGSFRIRPTSICCCHLWICDTTLDSFLRHALNHLLDFLRDQWHGMITFTISTFCSRICGALTIFSTTRSDTCSWRISFITSTTCCWMCGTAKIWSSTLCSGT